MKSSIPDVIHSESNGLEQVFSQAIEIKDATEQSRYLDQICDGDEELRQSVEKLLEAYRSIGNFMERSPERSGTRRCNALSPAVHVDLSEPNGAVIAGIELTERLGSGGMGDVFAGLQTEPINREVAVKLIRSGLATDEFVRRFRLERQTLAMLNHANIARVFDGGTTEDGRLYFVMELIRGQRISEYCDEQKLGIRPRLTLFLDVCRAVQYFHQRGIIHRDLKPANVLVTCVDGHPVPKIIDFGLSKFSESELGPSNFSGTGFGFLGTPQYMSPEQASCDHVKLDTRTDVYSLGVMLHELLVGTTPVTAEALNEQGYLKFQQLVTHASTSPLSALPASRAETEKSADLRGTTASVLKATIAGDLDCITRTALAVEPDERYASVEAFARDIERFLSDEPVEARPPSGLYNVRKFVRRHRTLVINSSLLLLTLILGLTGTAVAMFQAIKNQRVAVQARGQTLEALRSVKLANARERQARLEAEQAEAAAKLAKSNEALHREAAEKSLDEVAEVMQSVIAKIRNSKGLKRPEMQFLRTELLTESLRYYTTFVERNATTRIHRLQVGNAWCQAADISLTLSDNIRARKFATNAVVITSDLYALHPQNKDVVVATCAAHSSLATALTNLGIRDEALAHAERVIEIRQQAYEFEDSKANEREAAAAISFLGWVQSTLAYNAAAQADASTDLGTQSIESQMTALMKFEDMRAANPSDVGLIGEVMTCRQSLGAICANAGDLSAAAEHFRCLHELVLQVPAEDLLACKANAYQVLTQWELYSGDREESISHGEKSIQLFTLLRDRTESPSSDSSKITENIVEAHIVVATSCMTIDLDNAVRHIKSARRQIQDLDDNSHNAARLRMELWRVTTESAFAKRDFDVAVRSCHSWIQSIEPFEVREKSKTAVGRARGTAFDILSKIYEQQGDFAEALAAASNSIGAFELVVAQSDASDVDRTALDKSRSRRKRLEEQNQSACGGDW